MSQDERVHQELLGFEHPWTSDQDRACREVRKLLREDYGLEGDWPADADQPQTQATGQREREHEGRVGRVLSAMGDYCRNAGRRAPGTRRHKNSVRSC